MTDKHQMGYEEILQRGWDEIPEPQYLPDGTYRYRCTTAKTFAPKQADGDTRVLFAFEPQEAMDDVDTHALDALGANYDISENVVFTTVWLSKAADYARVRNILTKLGVNVEEFKGADGFKNSLLAAKNRELLGYTTLSQKADKATGAIRTENVIMTFAELN